MTLISLGFSNWKDALTKFRDHQGTECHRLSVEKHVTIPQTYGNVREMASSAAKITMQNNCYWLIKVIESLQYFGRQEKAIQGDTDSESNFYQLMKVRGNDFPQLFEWVEKQNDTYTSHDIQNEIISIMAEIVVRGIVEDIG